MPGGDYSIGVGRPALHGGHTFLRRGILGCILRVQKKKKKKASRSLACIYSQPLLTARHSATICFQLPRPSVPLHASLGTRNYEPEEIPYSIHIPVVLYHTNRNILRCPLKWLLLVVFGHSLIHQEGLQEMQQTASAT